MALTKTLETMRDKYNAKVPIMVERWQKAKGVIADRWREALTRVLGTAPDESFVRAIKAGVEAGAPKYEEGIKGKGEKLVKRFYEKLTGKLLG